MLNFETTVQDSKSYGDLTLSEMEPILKINLRRNKREFSTKIGKLLSIIPPIEANTSSSNEDYSILWLSPDEWLIYSNIKISYEQQNLLEENLFNDDQLNIIASVAFGKSFSRSLWPCSCHGQAL